MFLDGFEHLAMGTDFREGVKVRNACNVQPAWNRGLLYRFEPFNCSRGYISAHDGLDCAYVRAPVDDIGGRDGLAVVLVMALSCFRD